MKRFRSVPEWHAHEIQNRQAMGSAGRRRLRLLQRSGEKWVIFRLSGGRPLLARADAASQARRQKRWTKRAARLLPQVATELRRLRVVAKTNLVAASDVRRAMRFAREMWATSKHLLSLLLALWYERAWRDPVLSVAFLRHFQIQCAAGRDSLSATWASIEQTRSLAPQNRPNYRFWCGHNALHAAKGPWAWEPCVLQRMLRDISRHRSAVDAGEYAAKLSALPNVSAYSAFAYLRTLQALGCVTLLRADEAVASLSPTIAALTKICPLSSWTQSVQSLHEPHDLPVQPGDVALIIWETAKALSCLGFAVPKGSETDVAGFVREFGYGTGDMLLCLLRACVPLSEKALRREGGVRSKEASLVDQYFPPTQETWDRAPHVCRGSESLVSDLRQQLHRQGFLISRTV